MRTVHEVSELAHVSVRMLHHYDKIGLLKPSARSEAGYRLYGDKELARLQQIMLFRELEFSLADIGAILDSPDFDLRKALDQQLELLELRREHIGSLIDMTKALRGGEGSILEFERSTRASWTNTPSRRRLRGERPHNGRNMRTSGSEGQRRSRSRWARA